MNDCGLRVYTPDGQRLVLDVLTGRTPTSFSTPHTKNLYFVYLSLQCLCCLLSVCCLSVSVAVCVSSQSHPSIPIILNKREITTVYLCPCVADWPRREKELCVCTAHPEGCMQGVLAQGVGPPYFRLCLCLSSSILRSHTDTQHLFQALLPCVSIGTSPVSFFFFLHSGIAFSPSVYFLSFRPYLCLILFLPLSMHRRKTRDTGKKLSFLYSSVSTFYFC